MFQKCPICSGTGIDPVCNNSDTLPVCPVCNGRKIINSETGLPPVYKDQKEYEAAFLGVWKEVIDLGFANTQTLDEALAESKKEKPKEKSRFQQRLEELAKQRGYELPKK